MKSVNIDQVRKLVLTLTIPSQSYEQIIYSINTEIGIYLYRYGVTGASCKHDS